MLNGGISMFKWLKRRKNRLYYLHSSIYLPAPLNEAEETRLLKLVETENSIEARNILIEHNLRLVVYIAKKFESKQVLIEDLISIGSMGLIKGVQTFKLDKNIKLATYASRCIENEILMNIRANKNKKNVVHLQSAVVIDKDGNELELLDFIEYKEIDIYKSYENKQLHKELDKALQTLTSREYDIISRRYGLNIKYQTQKDISKELNISRSYVSRIEKRALLKLYLLMKNLK